MRALDSFEARGLPETEEGISRSGRPIVGRSRSSLNERLYRLDLASGERREVCAFIGNPRGGSWSATGSIIFATRQSNDLMRVPLKAESRHRSAPGRGELPCASVWPSFLPDGRTFPVLDAYENGSRRWHLPGSESDRAKRGQEAASSDTQAMFVAPGYLLFGRDTAALPPAVRCRDQQLSGDAVPCRRSPAPSAQLSSRRVLGVEHWTSGVSFRDGCVEPVHVVQSQG